LSAAFILNLSAGTISNYSKNVFIIKSISSLLLLIIIFADIRINQINLKEKLKEHHPKKIILVIILLLGYLLVTLSYSLDPIYGLQKILNFVTSSIPSIFAFYYLILTFSSRKPVLFIYPLVIISVVSLVIILSQYPFDQSMIYYFEPGRWSHVIYGRMIGFISLLLIVYILSLKDIKQIILYGIFAGLSAYGLYLSALRSAMIAFIVSIFIAAAFLVYKFFNDKINRVQIRNSLSGIVISVLVAALLILVIPSQKIIGDRFNNLTQIENLEFGGDEPIHSRIELLKISKLIFLDNPVFGIGFGGFKSYNELTEVLKYPHNIFIEMAVEAGIIGLIILCAVFFLMFRSVYKYSPYLLLLVSYSLILALFSKDVPSQTYLWIWLVFIGLSKVQSSEAIVLSSKFNG
jgi:O-antigen ligase